VPEHRRKHTNAYFATVHAMQCIILIIYKKNQLFLHEKLTQYKHNFTLLNISAGDRRHEGVTPETGYFKT
jgi:hypothetical protein